jgi:hypothetical protein
MKQGLKGSQLFGQQPAVAEIVGQEETELVNSEEINWFGDEEPVVETTLEDDGDLEGDSEGQWNDDGPEEEADELAGMFDEPGQATGIKATKLLNVDNYALNVDQRLVTDLSTVGAAGAFLVNAKSLPYDSMDEGQKYTYFQASRIIIRTLADRLYFAVQTAQSITEQDDLDVILIPGDTTVQFKMRLPDPKASAQAEESEARPISDLSYDMTAETQNAMADPCQNTAVGCKAPRLSHIQATGKCFKPNCPCKGRCEQFVGPPLAGQTQQQAEIGGTESARAALTSNAGGAGRPSGPVQRPTTPASGGGSGRPQSPVQRPGGGGGDPGTAGRPSGPVQRPTTPGGTTQQPSGNKPANAGVGTPGVAAVQQRPTPPNAARGTQSGGSSQQQAAAQSAGSAPQTQRESAAAVAGSEQGQAVEGGVEETQDARVTPDVLDWILRTGGLGPESPTYFPTIPDEDMSEAAVERRDFIIKKVVNYYSRAILQKDSKELRDDLDLGSTSYRVVLAANVLAGEIERYARAYAEEGHTPELDKTIEGDVGKAAKGYLDAHKALASGQWDGGWNEYAEYCEAFGLELGTLLHEVTS